MFGWWMNQASENFIILLAVCKTQRRKKIGNDRSKPHRQYTGVWTHNNAQGNSTDNIRSYRVRIEVI